MARSWRNKKPPGRRREGLVWISLSYGRRDDKPGERSSHRTEPALLLVVSHVFVEEDIVRVANILAAASALGLTAAFRVAQASLQRIAVLLDPVVEVHRRALDLDASCLQMAGAKGAAFGASLGLGAAFLGHAEMVRPAKLLDDATLGFGAALLSNIALLRNGAFGLGAALLRDITLLMDAAVLHRSVLDRAVLDRAVVVLHCTVLHCTVLHCTVLHCTMVMLDRTVLHRAVLHRTMLHRTVIMLNRVMQHCVMQHCVMLNRAVLYGLILFNGVSHQSEGLERADVTRP